ncbi:hypothetical protein A3C87_04220 [Candidatus Kaiserbacteria bacterium RIFCSPHIGHO2_02_FULL_49_34]|uniref:CARDB domain-containing protein n=1 Tax=Candidatus Kaiserbacteria bacterium RIFCSPHIGHO2_02_FULL_49_34 TaxID=1798491 RepID=A0A1F6DK15_9BACT|nr:MAG: hypothetical protein A3C87_04220 [Candidatus Kaiserbacteria bacterium RIFCSPHIGHO2_02_FULL_49_34]
MQFNIRSFAQSSAYATIAGFLAMALLVPQVHAIGISPPIIQAADVLRNSSQSYSVTLLIQDPAKYDMYFSAEPRGEFGHYLKGESEVVIPQGKTSVLYNFELEPIDAPVGSYNLQLAFTEKQKAVESGNGAEGGAKVVVLQGAILVISMGVTGEERVSYEITRSQFEDTEPRIPLTGTYTVKNTGNVEWKPERIEIEAYEVADPENTATFEVSGDSIPLVKPGKVLDAKMSLGHKLTEGRYRAKVRFYYKGEMVQELETSPFNVFQVGTLAQSGELLEVTTNKTSYNVGEQVVLRGLFKNTGDVTVEGQLETQVYKNGEFVNLEVSRTQSIDRRQEATFEQFLKMSEPGEYTLEVAATYGTRKTSVQKVTITVSAGGVGAVGNMYITIILLSLFVIGVIIFLIIFAKRRKKENGQGGVAVPVAAPQAAVVAATVPAASAVADTASASVPTPPPAAPQEAVVTPPVVVPSTTLSAEPATPVSAPIAEPEVAVAPEVVAPAVVEEPSVEPVVPTVMPVEPQEAPVAPTPAREATETVPEVPLVTPPPLEPTPEAVAEVPVPTPSEEVVATPQEVSAPTAPTVEVPVAASETSASPEVPSAQPKENIPTPPASV